MLSIKQWFGIVTEINPQLPAPEAFGWEKQGDTWKPVMALDQLARKPILHAVNCPYAK